MSAFPWMGCGGCGDPGVEAEVEAVGGVFVAEDIGCFELCHAVQEGPQRNLCLVRLPGTRERGDVFRDEEPKSLTGRCFFTCCVAGKQQEFVEVGVFAGEGEVGSRDAADRLLGRSFAYRALHRDVKSCGSLTGECGFEDAPVGEVAVERVGCEFERGCKRAQGEASQTVEFNLFDGCRKDGYAVCLGGERHGYHCTS